MEIQRTPAAEPPAEDTSHPMWGEYAQYTRWAPAPLATFTQWLARTNVVSREVYPNADFTSAVIGAFNSNQRL
jgi:hypothetical protein